MFSALSGKRATLYKSVLARIGSYFINNHNIASLCSKTLTPPMWTGHNPIGTNNVIGIGVVLDIVYRFYDFQRAAC